MKAIPVVTHKTQGRWAGVVTHGFPEEKGALGFHNWNHQVPQIIVTTAKFMN